MKDTDLRFTNPIVAKAIVDKLIECYAPCYAPANGWNLHTTQILEPSAGPGAFVRVLRDAFPNAWIDACEIRREERENLDRAGANTIVTVNFLGSHAEIAPGENEPKLVDDFRLATTSKGYDLIVGNPPFSEAEFHVRKALSVLKPDGVLAFLLKVTFLGAAERTAFFNDHPNWSMHPIIPRPSFTADKATDQQEYGLFVWHSQGAAQVRANNPVVWRVPKKVPQPWLSRLIAHLKKPMPVGLTTSNEEQGSSAHSSLDSIDGFDD